MESVITKTLRQRLATRAIKRDVLPEEFVDDLIEAARLTPSCFNNQPWRYLFIAGQAAHAEASEAFSGGNKPWASRAPLLIVGYTREADDCVLKDGRVYHQFDLGLATMNIMLAATAHGLVARPMAGFDPVKIKTAFGLDEDERPLVMMAVGYPSDDTQHLPEHVRTKHLTPRERKPAEEIVRRL